MQNESSCCSNLPATAPITSPFSRFIILNAVPDDMSGVAECGTCGAAYSFGTIQYGNPRHGHGRHEPTRYTLIHTMRRLPIGSFDRMADLVALTRKLDQKHTKFAAWLGQRFNLANATFYSHWPIWIIDWEQPQHIRENLNAALQTIIDSAPPPELLVAADDLTTGIIAARNVSPADLAQVHDWFGFLDLDNTASATR